MKAVLDKMWILQEWTPLQKAAWLGDTTGLMALLQTVQERNVLDVWGRSGQFLSRSHTSFLNEPLHVFSAGCNAVHYAICNATCRAKGANVSETGEPVASGSAAMPWKTDCLQLLLDARASVNLRTMVHQCGLRWT